jgi:hypothetical protein
MKSMSSYSPIVWSKENFLNWSDYQAELNPSSFEDAHSTIKYRHTWTVKSDNVDRQIQFYIENIQLTTEFFPLLSCVRLSQANLMLLKHEQGHFDLAELFRSKITKDLQIIFESKKFIVRGHTQEQQKQFAREYSNMLISKELEKLEKHIFQKQEEYDQYTDYGQIAEKQLEYDERFKELRI